MATKKTQTSIPPDRLALYDRLIATNPSIERKGSTLPYTSVNGNMFTFLSKNGELSMRLPAKEREEFIKKYKTRLSVQHGVVMKEYVVVPESLLSNVKVLTEYLDHSFAYARGLKEKRATRTKSSRNK